MKIRNRYEESNQKGYAFMQSEKEIKDKEAAIRQALEHHEFIVYYQPQYKALRGQLASAEALARWKKPDGSIGMPGEFIPYMEEGSLICELDWQILQEVCRFLKNRIDTGEEAVPIAVNFSRNHLDETDFVGRLCGWIDQQKIPHELIHIEITESSLASDTERIIPLVASIRAQGFHVAIDDFGSGLSSLSMVKDVDADILKIDRSLLFGDPGNDKDRIVLESIYEFAKRLHLTTVAEGVETREQLGFLRTCGCDLIQGYLFAKPMPEEAFSQICSRQTTAREGTKVCSHPAASQANTEVCGQPATARESIKNEEGETVSEPVSEDILMIQPRSSAMQLLIEVIFKKYPLVIFSNLTRNSYYMMTYDNFTTTSCPPAGVFDELIVHGASSMHPEDQQLFADTFRSDSLLAAHAAGQECVRIVTRQLGDDGIYRSVETADYFVKSPDSDDVLVITLCQNV
ncbi:MAG: EAL domain-containing protein [Lachnospiraceae bacterium]|nr:EAL domain-containing protein [Lachnospiraceae bacterium]